MRKTKVLATVGPATEDTDALEALFAAGVDATRLNMSHGTHEWHEKTIENIRAVNPELPIVMDTQGPEVRLGDLPDNTAVKEGSTVTVVEAEETSESDVVPVNHNRFLDFLNNGDCLVIGDSGIEIQIENVAEEEATGTVESGGDLYSGKSVHVPGRDLGLEAPTEKDREDIRFAVKAGADIIAASFVKTGADVETVRAVAEDAGRNVHVMAKIEHRAAIENLEEIVETADSIMVARGDLGVQLPAARVPVLQKQIIKTCNESGTPVVVATQMLASMMNQRHATRAEISDIANAVLDGADAVMLSEETAVGKHAIEAADVMENVITEVEDVYKPSGKKDHGADSGTDAAAVTEEICHSVWRISHDMPLTYIVAHTTSGHTAKHIAKYRPPVPIIAFTDDKTVERVLHLVWGVKPHYVEFPEHVDEMLVQSAEHIYAHEEVGKDDLLVMSAGVPTGTSGTTNMLEIRRVGELLEEGNNS